MGARFVLLFDADCGICTFFSHAVGIADLRGRIEPMALSDQRADAWFDGVSEKERFGSFHIVQPSGDCVARGRALIALVEALPLGAGFAHLATRMPVALDAAERAYDLLVRYRGFLAGLPTGPGATSATLGSS